MSATLASIAGAIALAALVALTLSRKVICSESGDVEAEISEHGQPTKPPVGCLI